MNNDLSNALDEVKTHPDEAFDLATVSEWAGLSPATLAKQVRRGKIKAERKGKRYRIKKEEALRVIETNAPMLLGWRRLVDVANELGFHRNIGESVCRKLDQQTALDMNGHCRISPDAEQALADWHADKQARKDWVRKIDLARELELDPRVVDNLVRKQGFPFDHDIHGFVVLSPEARKGVEQWKVQRDCKRMKVRELDGQSWYSLRKTAEDAAGGLLSPASKDYPRLVETYYRRYLLWMRNGLAYETFDGVRYFSQEVHDRLVDDLCVMEASRIGGVGVSTVKGWLSAGKLSSSDYFRCRRSISRKEYFAFLRRMYVQSPRLRRKQMVPVKMIEDLSHLSRNIGMSGVDDLILALERETGIPAKELVALKEERGFIHRSVKNTLDKWILLAEQGLAVSAHAAAVAAIDETPADEGENEHRKMVLQLVATYLQKKVADVYDLVFGESTEVSEDVAQLLKLIASAERVGVYSPERQHEAGELLVHPSGGDYGYVVELVSDRAIKVQWEKEFGTMTMAQNVESDYSAMDTPSLVLH